MKKTVLQNAGLITGYLLLAVILAAVVVSKYDAHQQVLADQNNSQTQAVNSKETALQKQVAAAQALVKSSQTQLSNLSADKQQACADLVQVQSVLAKQKLSVPVDIPSFCN
jgi:peptidoglycan hydrolase CwlO-like protein